MQWLARCLIHYAARRAPGFLSARLDEEWFADASAQGGAIARIRFALGCCWASRVISRDWVEHIPSSRPHSGPIAHFIRFPPEASLLVADGRVAFVLIVGVQAAAFYGVAIGLRI
jgi:hypothetical protein